MLEGSGRAVVRALAGNASCTDAEREQQLALEVFWVSSLIKSCATGCLPIGPVAQGQANSRCWKIKMLAINSSAVYAVA